MHIPSLLRSFVWLLLEKRVQAYEKEVNEKDTGKPTSCCFSCSLLYVYYYFLYFFFLRYFPSSLRLYGFWLGVLFNCFSHLQYGKHKKKNTLNKIDVDC